MRNEHLQDKQSGNRVQNCPCFLQPDQQAVLISREANYTLQLQ